MKTFKVTFVKIEKIVKNQPGPVQLAEQTIKTDKETINISIPPGYTIMSVVELLPPVTDLSYDIKPFYNEKTLHNIKE